jgi:hypothetical protein
MTAEDDRQALFARAVAGMLRPLVKALIANGVTLGTMHRALKQLYVEVAEDEFRLAGKPPTDSRVAVLTGVHRKDVRALRAARTAPAAEAPHRSPTVIATVLGRWLADPATTDADGRPLPLPRQAAAGPSFDALAASVSRDVRPRTLLDEMARQGLVTVDPDGRVRLDPAAVAGSADIDTRARFFAANLGDHMAAATENLLAPPGAAPFFERAVFYNRLSADSAGALEAEGRTLGTRLLETVNRAAFARQQADAADPAAGARIRVGVYVYREGPAGGAAAAAPAAGGDGDG